jgi:hypothetical protein
LYTYLGFDNVQKDQLVLVCKNFNETGQIKQLWREKLRSDTSIAQFFRHLSEHHWPITIATTGVGRDPAGVLRQHVERGGLLIRYHHWELAPRHPNLPQTFHRAELLALQAIHDEQFPLMVRVLSDQLAGLQASIWNLSHQASGIAERLSYLEGNQLGFDEIPF